MTTLTLLNLLEKNLIYFSQVKGIRFNKNVPKETRVKYVEDAKTCLGALEIFKENKKENLDISFNKNKMREDYFELEIYIKSIRAKSRKYLPNEVREYFEKLFEK